MLFSRYKTSIIQQPIRCFKIKLPIGTQSSATPTHKHCQVINSIHTRNTFSFSDSTTKSWPFISNRNTLYEAGNQGLIRFAYGLPVIWTFEWSSGPVSKLTLGCRVSVMPGLHWTHVWNRRSEDPVTYWRLKHSSGAGYTQCWGREKMTPNTFDTDLMFGRVTLKKNSGRFDMRHFSP